VLISEVLASENSDHSASQVENASSILVAPSKWMSE
jgi:hypothetical protein